jgi:small GTP-binding protein
MPAYDYTWKIMMLGDRSVPKTSLTIRYISGFFLEDLRLTIGVDFYSKTTGFKEKKVKLQIWDFGGEERFRFLLHQYCKGANGAMFLYDITNPLTLAHLPDWIQLIRGHAGNIPIMLIGTRLHLERFRVVTREEGMEIARWYNLSSFVELSSKTGQNVEMAFEVMTETLFERFNGNTRLYSQLSSVGPNPINAILRRAPHPEMLRKAPHPKIIKKEFKINEKLTVKLENNRTNIYVDGRLFNQCKYLLLNLSTSKIRAYDRIDSIDEAAETLGRNLERSAPDAVISPETEFWGHCSNIQVWYENNYDTRILHRNLAFPLLKALAAANDALAKKVFKEEIALRLESGYPSVVFYLIEKGFLKLLTEEELNTIIESPKFLKNLHKWFSNKNIPAQLSQKIKTKLYNMN